MLKVELHNESRAVGMASEDAAYYSPKLQLFALADGFGGQGVGNLGAQDLLKKMATFVENGLGDSEVTLPFIYRSYYTAHENLLFNAMLFANQDLCEKNANKNLNARLGASAILGLVRGSKLTLAHVGNCHAFLLRKGFLRELVQPRSYNSYLGYSVSWEVGSWNTHTNFPLTALGLTRDLEPEIFEYELEVGDQILICSDGYYGGRHRDEIMALCHNLSNRYKTDEKTQEFQRFIQRLHIQPNGDDLSIISMSYL